MTIENSERACLKYYKTGSLQPMGSFGHEYVRFGDLGCWVVLCCRLDVNTFGMGTLDVVLCCRLDVNTVCGPWVLCFVVDVH